MVSARTNEKERRNCTAPFIQGFVTDKCQLGLVNP